MEFSFPNFTLPAVCHLVCQLVTTGISGGNFNDSAVNQLPVGQHSLTTLPSGYVAHPDVGFAYRVYNRNVTWTDAWKHCTEEGAQLALIDSAKKVQYVKRQMQHTTNLAHVGITRAFDGETWTAVSTGIPLSSIYWTTDKPNDGTNCVQLSFGGNGLGSWSCDYEHNYICELPILEKNTTSVN